MGDPMGTEYVDVADVVGATLRGIRLRVRTDRELEVVTSEAYLLLFPGRPILFPRSGDSRIRVASPPFLARAVREPRVVDQVVVAVLRQTLHGKPDGSESAVFELANGTLIAHQTSAPFGTGYAGIEVLKKSRWLAESADEEGLAPF